MTLNESQIDFRSNLRALSTRGALASRNLLRDFHGVPLDAFIFANTFVMLLGHLYISTNPFVNNLCETTVAFLFVLLEYGSYKALPSSRSSPCVNISAVVT